MDTNAHIQRVRRKWRLWFKLLDKWYVFQKFMWKKYMEDLNGRHE